MSKEQRDVLGAARNTRNISISGKSPQRVLPRDEGAARNISLFSSNFSFFNSLSPQREVPRVEGAARNVSISDKALAEAIEVLS